MFRQLLPSKMTRVRSFSRSGGQADSMKGIIMIALPFEVKAFNTPISVGWITEQTLRSLSITPQQGAAPMISSTEERDETPDVSCEDCQWNEEKDLNGIFRTSRGKANTLQDTVITVGRRETEQQIARKGRVKERETLFATNVA